MASKIIKYNLIGANKANIKTHPQCKVEELGMQVLRFEGVPIAYCVFMEVDEIIDDLPEYIERAIWEFTYDN